MLVHRVASSGEHRRDFGRHFQIRSLRYLLSLWIPENCGILAATLAVVVDPFSTPTARRGLHLSDS